MSILAASHPRGSLVWPVLFILSILVGAAWYLAVAVIYIFLMTNRGESLLVCLLASPTHSLAKCLFRSFAHLKNYACLLINNSFIYSRYESFVTYVLQIFSLNLWLSKYRRLKCHPFHPCLLTQKQSPATVLGPGGGDTFELY